MKISIPFAAICFAVTSPAQASEVDELTELRAEIERSFADDFAVVAVCGSSTGKTIYRDEILNGWQDDAVSTGRLIFVIRPNNEKDVMFADVTGELQSATAEGGAVIEVYSDDTTGSYMWMVAYPSTGVTETFNIALGSSEAKLVFWTSSKPPLKHPTNPPVSLGPKVAAFVARCV